MKKLVLVALMLILSACKTTENISPPPIAIPSGFTENEIKAAILMATMDQRGDGLTAGQRITDHAIGAILNNYASAGYSTNWFFESNDGRIVYVGYRSGIYYMHVSVDYNTMTGIKLKIVDSKNLKQDGDVIHKRALQWLDSFENRLRVTLGLVARRKFENS
jgi:hypothetical protein